MWLINIRVAGDLKALCLLANENVTGILIVNLEKFRMNAFDRVSLANVQEDYLTLYRYRSKYKMTRNVSPLKSK